MFHKHMPAIPAVIANALETMLVDAAPVGSRVTCNPAPTDTDEDWLVLTSRDPEEVLRGAGFTTDGSPEFYTGNDAGGFRSWRLGELNLIVTQETEFFDRFITGTILAARFNLLNKGDRIALFQAVLYGVRAPNLEAPHTEMIPKGYGKLLPAAAQDINLS